MWCPRQRAGLGLCSECAPDGGTVLVEVKQGTGDTEYAPVGKVLLVLMEVTQGTCVGRSNTRYLCW